MAFDRSAVKDKYVIFGGKTVAVSKLNDAQLLSALTTNARNRGAIAPGWTISSKGQVVREAPKAAAPQAPSTPAPTPAPPAAPPSPHLTDPIYQQERAALDLELNQGRREYERQMGTDGAKGQIWQDYDHAVNALTRGNRKNIGQTNAGLSGANLSGSGIAKKSLSDIAAEFFSDKSKMDTDRTRAETGATENWGDLQTYHKASDLAGMRGAANRWSLTNEFETPETPAKGKATAPPGKQYVKNPNGTGWKLVNKKATAPKGMQYVKNPASPGKFKLQPVAQKKATAPPGMKYVKNPSTGKYKAQRI